MSDEQFQSILAWMGDRVSDGNESLTELLGGMHLGHWMLVGVGLICWGVMMMRGLGLKKFQ
ncbi:MAG TPA: hypothetical protein PLI18_00855 [Pirellulaceae bacterium]|jgi:hypothetical protein|nr:hypothetical protein [Pirellulaceae bacterium]